VPLTPGVDVDTFRPGVDGARIRARYGLGDQPVIVCVSRLVPRKGQDTLIDVLTSVRQAVPRTQLLIVGAGPYRADLERRAAKAGLREHVVFTGAVPFEELPAHFAAGDVFAMPCRTRRGGLDVEGLGIVYLEASAVGLPVIAGDSGGAPDAVLEGETGFVVRDAAGLTARLVELLTDGQRRARMGAAGRAWVERDWQWDQIAARLRGLLNA
jgi:phosphatidyl-myo-inositol dimannoside synthase